jgi:hypothetical protein
MQVNAPARAVETSVSEIFSVADKRFNRKLPYCPKKTDLAGWRKTVR